MTRPFTSIFTALPFFSLCSAIQLGEWRDLPKSGSLTNLSQQTWSFNTSHNLDFCNRRRIIIEPGGTRDYTKRFNDALASLGKLGGGTLQLLKGTYSHSDQIKIPSYVCLIGAGKDQTFIRLVDNAPRFRKSGSIRSMHTERVTVMHLTQDGNRANQGTNKDRNYGRYGFFSELTNFLYIKNVSVRNNFGYGYDPHGSKKHYSYYLVIEDCDAFNNGLDGFTIDQTVHATIINGFSRANLRHGYNVVTGTQLALFRHCIADTNGKGSAVGYGFVAQNNQNFGTSRLAFQSCTAIDNFRGAFKLRDVFNVQVKNSRMTGNGDSVCYELSQTRNIQLRGNECSGIRFSRKFKLGIGASYTETADRSKLTMSRADSPRQPQFDPNAGPDPSCQTGTRNVAICCSSSCTKCGGIGCGAKANGPGSASCCVGAIRAANKPCTRFPPPCMI